MEKKTEKLKDSLIQSLLNRTKWVRLERVRIKTNIKNRSELLFAIHNSSYSSFPGGFRLHLFLLIDDNMNVKDLPFVLVPSYVRLAYYEMIHLSC